MPKEMLPIVDKPTIQYIVEEAIDSGIEDIIIVTGKGKRAIEDHFDHVLELEQNLLEKGKYELFEKVQASSHINIHYIRQKEPKELGFIQTTIEFALQNEELKSELLPYLIKIVEGSNKRIEVNTE